MRKAPMALLAGLLLAGPAGAQEAYPVYKLQADGLACPFCAYGIEKQLGKIDGVVSIEVEIDAGIVSITMQTGRVLNADEAERAVEAAGFTMGRFEGLEAGE